MITRRNPVRHPQYVLRTSYGLEALEADRRVALHLLDKRHLPGEIVASVLLEAGLVVVGLVPDVVARGARVLRARFPGPLPCGVAAVEDANLRFRPQRLDLRRGEMGEHAVLRSQKQHTVIADLLARLLEARAHHPPRARYVTMVETQAGGEIEHGAAGLCRDWAGLEAKERRLARPTLNCETGKARQYVDLVPAHLREPRGAHHGAPALRVDEHEPRVAHANVLVSRLHELPARCMTRAGEMAGFEFLARAHVEQIQGPRRIARPLVDFPGVGELVAEALRHPFGGGLGPCQ